MFLIIRTTKPKYPATMLDRSRLYQQLDCWTEKRAIFIHAPSGYGKSSLVSRWLDHAGLATQAAWLSLDESDNDPHHFVLHLTAALDRILPGAYDIIRPILEDSQGNAERALNRLFSTFWNKSGPHTLPSDQHIHLVLDDLHRVQSPDVEAAIRLILEMGPANLHLLLLARQRTSLPLARLYAHGDLLALSAADLRFNPEEIGDYLRLHGFRPPTAMELARLSERSEGWVTGLQLAVLTLDSHHNASDLLAVLHGQNIWLADYMADEVLNHQSPDLRRFLLQTSILEEFNAELCDAVTGDKNAYTRLDEVVRRDLFLILLGERAQWFRYHHLFQELLQHRLHARFAPEEVAELHRRAAAWLAGAGNVEAAVQHLLKAGADDQAMDLVETQMRSILLRTPYEARSLLALLPPDLQKQSPQLMLDRCRLATLFDDKSTLAYADEAGKILQAQLGADARADQHRAEWLVFRSSGHFIMRDLAAAYDCVRLAQDDQGHLDEFHLGLLRFLQMHLASYEGKWLEMEVFAAESIAAFMRGEFTPGIVAVRRERAKWSMHQGNSSEAASRFQELFDHWNSDHLPALRDLVFAYFPAIENSYWMNRIDLAKNYLATARGFAEQLQDPDLIGIANCLGRQLASHANSNGVEVHDLAGLVGQFTRPAASDQLIDCETRLLISRGKSDLAWSVFREHGITLQNIPMDHVHRRLISFLRAAIAHGHNHTIVEQALEQALGLARESADRFNQLHLLALTAWHTMRQKGAASAMEPLLEAVELARDTGYVRILLDIPILESLMQEMGISLTSPVEGSEYATAETPEPITLTEQERRVLELLAADYKYDQIAAEMTISVNTVRSHVRNAYRKLGVKRRNQAVSRAIRFGLLMPRSGEQ